MAKNIIKELIILLLIILAIILVLGVLLYEYAPSNKIIPEKVAYSTPEEVKTELQSDNEIDTTEILATYHVDATDLSNYKKSNDYIAGKSNPFAKPNSANETTTEGENGGTTAGTTTQGTSTPNESTMTQNNSSGYLPDKGTK